jgi:RNA recognition motif-containing protein
VYITEKGYAFVTMDDEGEARAAIDELNGSNIDGQEVILSELS